MNDSLEFKFFQKDRSLIISPAGCGKTELIARAISHATSNLKRQLILTHTHAGIKSIQDRLKKLNVSQKLYYVDTIDGFCLNFALSFPKNSGLGYDYDPSLNEWDRVINAAIIVFSSKYGINILRASFSGLFVDEYQDCSPLQHQLILTLANQMPTHIVGDPLQGIFDFGTNRVVNWYQDVFPNFERIDKEYQFEPYRWKHKNEDLGRWLIDIREVIKRRQNLHLHNLPSGVTWKSKNRLNQSNSCLNNIQTGETTVAIHHFAEQSHNFARSLSGKYKSMEEVENKRLIFWLNKLETSCGLDQAINIIDFSSDCLTKVSTELSTIRSKLTRGDIIYRSGFRYLDVFLLLLQISQTNDFKKIIQVLKLIRNISGANLFRQELWNEFLLVLFEKTKSLDELSLLKIAWDLKSQKRHFGKILPYHVVSRVLLIKGLEFDNCIILDADVLNIKELYVAMTRGSKTLTILSDTPILVNNFPIDLLPPKK